MDEVKAYAGHMETEADRQLQKLSEQEREDWGKGSERRGHSQALWGPATRGFQSPVVLSQQMA